MKHIYFILFLFVFSITTKANPGNYYNSIDTNLSCSPLKTALFHLISSNYTQISYSDVKSAYLSTDMHKSDDGLRDIIWDMYSDNPIGPEPYEYPFTTVYPSTITAEGMGLNREHIFPQSWFDYGIPDNIDPIPKTDLFHLFPSDGYVNNQKSNYPIGKVNSTPNFISLNGSKVGYADTSIHFTIYSSNNYKNKVFEPRDEYKGDFARAYLYIITRYEDLLPSWNSYPTSAKDVLDGNKYPGFDSWILKLCISWSKLDPPSVKEINRNDAVFAIQGNRNPYIDYPHWVEKVFGPDGISACTEITTGIRTQNNIPFSIYPNPTTNTINIQFATNYNTNKNAVIEIIDVVGKTVLSQEIVVNKGVETINVSNLSKGIYILNIKSDGQNNVTSFVKE